jgi:glucoside 3-dehydrogenase (cytochrome c) hitch-hiker subunit
MDRRELLKMIAVLTGAAVVGGDAFLSGCTSSDKQAVTFTDQNIAFLDEVAETILPKTNTPGAKEAEVGKFMKVMVTDCYKESDQKEFLEGIGKLDEACKKMHGHGFMQATPEQRKELLISLEKDAKEHQKKKSEFEKLQDDLEKDALANRNKDFKREEMPSHYYTMMKQLTLTGFFTSKVGATQVLRHVAVPGKYEGCIPYKKGDRAWA